MKGLNHNLFGKSTVDYSEVYHWLKENNLIFSPQDFHALLFQYLTDIDFLNQLAENPTFKDWLCATIATCSLSLGIPQNFTAIYVAQTDDIALSWDAVTGAEYYEVRRDGGFPDAVFGATSTIFNVPEFFNPSYNFEVRAVRGSDFSEWSPIVTCEIPAGCATFRNLNQFAFNSDCSISTIPTVAGNAGAFATMEMIDGETMEFAAPTIGFDDRLQLIYYTGGGNYETAFAIENNQLIYSENNVVIDTKNINFGDKIQSKVVGNKLHFWFNGAYLGKAFSNVTDSVKVEVYVLPVNENDEVTVYAPTRASEPLDLPLSAPQNGVAWLYEGNFVPYYKVDLLPEGAADLYHSECWLSSNPSNLYEIETFDNEFELEGGIRRVYRNAPVMGTTLGTFPKGVTVYFRIRAKKGATWGEWSETKSVVYDY